MEQAARKPFRVANTSYVPHRGQIGSGVAARVFPVARASETDIPVRAEMWFDSWREGSGMNLEKQKGRLP